MAINNIPLDGTVLEKIEIRQSTTLSDAAIEDCRTGEFLVLDRYFRDSYRTNIHEQVLVYGVHRRLTAEEFYGLLGQTIPAACTVAEIEDHLVSAFDHGVANMLDLESAMFAYRNKDRKLALQHST